MNVPNLHVIIPAGGAGTRLWPLSRRSRPKFLLDLLDTGRSLLQDTVLRLAPVACSFTIVTGRDHQDAVQHQLSDLRLSGDLPLDTPVQVLAEPTGRDSMPAIGLATYVIRQSHGDNAVVGSFAADHDIRDQGLFLAAVSRAVGGALEGFVATIGLEPSSPSTAFGYIEPTSDQVSESVFKVARFVEKPDAETALDYVSRGFLWNAGMFVMKCGTLVSAMQHLHPQMDEDLSALASLWDTSDPEQIDMLWERLPRVAIDHAIAEPLALDGGIAVTPLEPEARWSDVGDFVAMHETRESSVDAPSSTEEIDSDIPDPAIAPLLIDSDGSIVHVESTPGAARRKIVVLGIPDAIVIDSGDALLVTTRDLAQKVKDAPKALKDQGLDHLI